MHCKQARQQIDRLSPSSPELTEHTAQCEVCARFLEERTALGQALGQLRAEAASLGPSAHVEQQVLAAFNAATFQPRGSEYPWRWFAWRWVSAGSLVFATLLIATVFSTVIRPHHAALDPAPVVQTPQEEPFIAMPYVIPPAPYERTTVIRTHISSQIMQYAGLSMHDDPGETTLADVVYGQDGRILALRLVSPTNSGSEKRMN